MDWLERSGPLPIVLSLHCAYLVWNDCSGRNYRLHEYLLSENDVWMRFLQAHLDSETALRRLEIEFKCEKPEVLPNIQPFLSSRLDVIPKYKPKKTKPSYGSPSEGCWQFPACSGGLWSLRSFQAQNDQIYVYWSRAANIGNSWHLPEV
ncbi:hypothetical protein C8R43DRAFT_950984 [Mycena crocata]|nr:hypothetical protein C8R43DRAFT_950984 [Mycena crocata]